MRHLDGEFKVTLIYPRLQIKRLITMLRLTTNSDGYGARTKDGQWQLISLRFVDIRCRQFTSGPSARLCGPCRRPTTVRRLSVLVGGRGSSLASQPECDTDQISSQPAKGHPGVSAALTQVPTLLSRSLSRLRWPGVSQRRR